jgi:hypothetical protein
MSIPLWDLRALESDMNVSQKGVAALMTVVVIGAVALIMAFSATFLGLSEIDQAFVLHNRGTALAAAEGCMEDTLLRMDNDITYDGLSPPIYTDTTCFVSITQWVPDLYVVTTKAMYKEYNSTILTIVNSESRPLQLLTWFEAVE